MCFTPALLLLLLGLIFLPSQIWFLLTEPWEGVAEGAFSVAALVTGGVAGTVALSNLLGWILSPSLAFLPRYWTLAGAVAGGAALLPYLWGPVDSTWWRFVGWMPVLCTAHLMYLGRSFLFPRGR